MLQHSNELIKHGYEQKKLQTFVYSDAARQFDQWVKKQGIQLYLHSEMSKYVTKLAMEASIHGNLDLLVDGYFHRQTEGPLTVPTTYTNLFAKKKIPFDISETLFVSHSLSQVCTVHMAV